MIWTAFILFSLDFLLTAFFLNFSDHASEGNPLIHVHSGYLILAINFVYFVVIFFLAKWIERYQGIIVQAKGTFDYVKKLYLSEHYQFIFVCLAFSFIHATLVSRFIVVLDWIVFGFNDGSFHLTTYYSLRQQMPFERFDILAGFLSFFVFLCIWFRMEFQKSLLRKESSNSSIFLKR